ncbi:MAG: hypothetical protein IJT98_05155 [Prevotella sp.]|nr:hypothetical protein [Prevotella sp.]
MTTTISTTSKNHFTKIQKYLYNKRVFSTPSLNNGVYSITIFDLSTTQTNELIQKMTRHFHLISNSQSEPMALAA